MRHFSVSLSAVVLFTALASCEAINEHDRGMLGQPSRAVAMYSAQVQFAHDACGSHVDASESARFVTMSARNGLSLAHYQRQYPEFTSFLNEASRKYKAGWESMMPAERDKFCQQYSSDVEGFRTIRVVQNSMDFQRYFSPSSDQFVRNAEQRAVAGGVILGAVAITSATGGIKDINSGNYNRSQQRFSTTSAAGELMASMATTFEANYCPSYRPFMDASAPAGHAIWRTHHSIQQC